MNLDIVDRNLLNLLQVEFPIISKPYTSLGENLDITEDEVIRRIEGLKTAGLIRLISPLLDTSKLGYKTTLVAMRVTETELDKTTRIIVNHPGVSHAYERNHHFNLWFTLAFPFSLNIDTMLKQMFSTIRAEAIFTLPALKLFKLRVYFDSGGDGQNENTLNIDRKVIQQETKLSPEDRIVINEIQQDLPLIPHPFSDMAVKLGMNEGEFLEQYKSLLSRGIIRRFSASVNHRKVGYTANAMTCWTVPREEVEIAGQRLASLQEVSHCYERKTNPLWRYNLFAMIHSQTREGCQQIADKVSNDTGLIDYVLLFSTREFKKTRIKYPV